MSILAPLALGFVTISPTSYIFSTFVFGETLEKRWPHLMKDQKAPVCSQLADVMSQLHHLPHSSSIRLGPFLPRMSANTRVCVCPSGHPILKLSDFLTSRPARGICSGYLRWLRSLLRNDYRIMPTHGDFHPRNIMVADEPDGGVRVSGIIDWAMGGCYPEYWEMYKALNTRGASDETDSWDSLPEAIMGYEREVVERRLIEQATQS